MSEVDPIALVPPGVNDARSRAFARALFELLAEFRTEALVTMEDAWEAPDAMLPAMVLTAGMTDFVSPGMREELVRALIADAPAIHAQTGTIAGIKRALAAIGISTHWTQWWQETPKAPHDTHKVFLFATDTIIAGQELLAPANQAAARRVIDATKRWSQDEAVSYGIRNRGPLYIGALASTAITAVAKPFQFDPPTLRATAFIGVVVASFMTATAHPKAA